jgi:predicted enzyme related to lactoylglutathione lyase
MKPIFDVQSLTESLEQVPLKGGVVTDMTFTLDGLTRRDVLDPEGNVIQLRSSL